MNCIPSTMYSNGFNSGEIIWARRDYDGMYWPGKINYLSNNTNTADGNNCFQVCSYFVQFLSLNQVQWTVHILPYRQYRDYMMKNLLIHYESLPQMKYQFLSAIHQADCNQINTDTIYPTTPNTSLTTCQTNTTDHSMNYYPQSSNSYQDYFSNHSQNTQLPVNNYCSCCTQVNSSLSMHETIMTTNANQTLQINTQYAQTQSEHSNSENNDFLQITSIIILTTKSYSNSSFISFLTNSFSTFPHHSIIYIDDPTTFPSNHSSTSNIYYLICLDQFDATIKQTLDSAILNNLNVHINYLFLILNSPSNELIKHLYSTVMDHRTLLVLHYHSTFDNEPLLLCSGNRMTFEMIEKFLLKYLCSKIKYLETDNNEQVYSMDNIKSEPMIHSNSSNEYVFDSSSLSQDSKKHGKKNLKHRSTKSKTSKHYPVRNLLQTFDESK